MFIFDETLARRRESKDKAVRQRRGKPIVYSERNMAKLCLQALEMAAQTGVSPDDGRSTYKDRAFRILQQMEESELLLDTDSYLKVLGICENDDDWRRASILVREMDTKGMQASPDRRKAVFLQAVHYAGQAEDYDEVWTIFTHLAEKTGGNDFALDVDLYDLISEVLREANQLVRAEKVEIAKEARYTRKFAQKIINAGKKKRWQEAIGILDEIREEGFNDNLTVHNTAMSSLEKAGEWPAALLAFENMKKRNLTPDGTTHTAIVGSMVNRLDVDKAAEWLRVMREQSVEPDKLTYAKVITRMVELAHFESALRIWDELRSRGVTPTQKTCDSVVMACQQLELWESLLEVVGLMQKWGLHQTENVTYAAEQALLALNPGLTAIPQAAEAIAE